jgi:hypothetical protein
MTESTVKKGVRKAEPKKEVEVVAETPIKVVEQVENVSANDDMNKKFDMLMDMVKSLQAENAELKARSDSAPKVIESNRMVKIIHLCDNVSPLKTHIQTHNVLLNFGRFEETATLTFQQFEELFREYRDYFERNVIGLTSDDEDLCDMYNIKKTYHSPLNRSILENVANIKDEDLKRIYNTVASTQKDVIIRSFATGYFETDESGKYPKDRRYNNRDRADLLNRLSGGKLKRILDDMDEKAHIK